MALALLMFDIAYGHALQKPVIITEIGYHSTIDAAVRPWEWQISNIEATLEEGLQTQANCYEAFCRALWEKEFFAGIYFWKWHPNYRDAGGAPTSQRSSRCDSGTKVGRLAFVTRERDGRHEHLETDVDEYPQHEGADDHEGKLRLDSDVDPVEDSGDSDPTDGDGAHGDVSGLYRILQRGFFCGVFPGMGLAAVYAVAGGWKPD